MLLIKYYSMSKNIKNKPVRCIHLNGMETLFLGSNAVEAALELKKRRVGTLNPVIKLIVE